MRSTQARTGTDSPARVPFNPLSPHHEAIRAGLVEAFERVVDSNAFILGGETERFERDFAAYCSVSECVGVASGTSALWLALAAAGIGPGDEVIVPAHTFIASALAIVHVGATPVLCDVEPDTGLIDAASAQQAISERTAAIVAVHLYGQPCDMDPLVALARQHGLFLLEDAAQAHGSSYDGRPAGSLGDAAAFSFYPGKNLGALGDGGAVCTSDQTLAERVRRLRHLGQKRKGDHQVLGYNERLDGLQAALLAVKLPYLDERNAARRHHAHRYNDLLPAPVRTLVERPGRIGNYHLYPVRVPERDRVAATLDAMGIDTGIHYAPALDEQPPIAAVARQPVPLDASRAWAREELSLPMFPELGDEEIDQVVAACREATHDRGAQA